MNREVGRKKSQTNNSTEGDSEEELYQYSEEEETVMSAKTKPHPYQHNINKSKERYRHTNHLSTKWSPKNNTNISNKKSIKYKIPHTITLTMRRKQMTQ